MTATLCINETFLSIQGESSFAGKLCFFIRTAGCNLNCSYCDTGYSRNAAAGRNIAVDALVEQARDAGAALVEITGGEPLLQPATPELCRRLLAAGFTVLLETNGSLPLRELPPEVIKIVDGKTPSSGEAGKNLFANYETLSPDDEIKFIISGREDYEYAQKIISEYRLGSKVRNILFSPAWGAMSPEQLAQWMIADRSPARLQLQLHKIIWGPDKTGV